MLAKVGMGLNLVVDWTDLTASKQVVQHRNWAVAHTDTSNLTVFDQFLHFFPDQVVWWILDGLLGRFPVNVWSHPVDDPEV